MLRPPVNRAMQVLDRTFFQKDVPISAARVHDARNISRVRMACSKSNDIFTMRSIIPVQTDPSDVSGSKKCLLLKPGIIHNDSSTWSKTISSLTSAGDISLIPYNLRLAYEHWSALEILQAILPEDLHNGIPVGFHHVGHIAHFNLRERYMPYKNIIGQVTIDKNSTIETVINKVDTLDSENEFRVLQSELIAGNPRYTTEVKEQNCVFQFDFSKVFWNSKQGHEHERLVRKFQPGEAVCDVMAGCGPFAIPAAKKKVFVWANDLNPYCFDALNKSVTLNKVSEFTKVFNADGHQFIRSATDELLSYSFTAKIPSKLSRFQAVQQGIKPANLYRVVHAPHIFSHYIMNLPATAIDFLPSFIGLFSGKEDLFQLHEKNSLPMVHCYCFESKTDESDEDFARARQNILARVSRKINTEITLETPEVELCDIRDVAPSKHQFRISFRLPREVAFATKSPNTVGSKG